MTKPIIRTEVQATPTLDMFGRESFYYRIYQIIDGAQITLTDGTGHSLGNAHYIALEAVKKYI